MIYMYAANSNHGDYDKSIVIHGRLIWALLYREKPCFMPYANNKGADQPAHQRSLISTFVVRCLVSIPILAKSKISRLWLVFEAKHAGWKNPKDFFLVTWFVYLVTDFYVFFQQSFSHILMLSGCGRELVLTFLQLPHWSTMPQTTTWYNTDTTTQSHYPVNWC